MLDFRAFKSTLDHFIDNEEITPIWFHILSVMSRSFLKLYTFVTPLEFGA